MLNGRTLRVASFLIALTLGPIVVTSSGAEAAPLNGTTIRAVQNPAGTTAIIIVTSKKNAKDSIVVTSSSLQRSSGSKTLIIGSVSVGKNGTAVITSVVPLPEKSTLSVFAGSSHLMTIFDFSIPTVATLPKSSKAAVLSKSTAKKILQVATDKWRVQLEKSKEPIITMVFEDPIVLREVLDSAVATLNAYSVAGGDIKNQVAVALASAINARPLVASDITTATNAVRDATARLPIPEAKVGNPVQLDPVALREANDFAQMSLKAYLVAGGGTQDQPFLSLLEVMKVFPQVVADITAAANALRAATNNLPPRVDPARAAEEEVLRGLVVKAEAILDSYFAAGGSAEDDVALALLRALNAEPQKVTNIADAMNAVSYATTQLPTNDNLVEIVVG